MHVIARKDAIHAAALLLNNGFDPDVAAPVNNKILFHFVYPRKPFCLRPPKYKDSSTYRIEINYGVSYQVNH